MNKIYVNMSELNHIPESDRKSACENTNEEVSYGQTKRSFEYTSENHKVEVSNLPPQTKYHLVRHMIEKNFKLAPRKIRVGRGVAFLAFTNVQDRDEAIARLNQKEWKGRTLEAKVAGPRDDLLAKKLCRDKTCEDESKVNHVDSGDEDESETLTADDIIQRVCPLWTHEYEDQLKIKNGLMRSVLNIGTRLMKDIPGIKRDHPKLYKWIQSNQGVCCQYDGVEPSPVTTNYRNKCEFNIGSDGTIGFKMGRYKNGSDRVVCPPPNCPIIDDVMLKIIRTLQDFIQKSNQTRLVGFNHVSHEGNLRQITVRLNQKREYLIIVDLHPQNIDNDALEVELRKMVDAISSNDEVKSIYVNASERLHMSGSEITLTHKFGLTHLCEHLIIDNSSLKFRIGPSSFFQINTKGAEILYKSIIDLAQLDSRSLVLDVGCGTGTIGLSLARQVRFVIGIEIVKSAIEDAKTNASMNGIENILFFAGKAEDLINETISIMTSKQEEKDGNNIVAIVDPPRTGFNSSFIKHIRASRINKIIYVACDPKANSNLISLCRPRSKAYQGEPFIPVRAKAFDLFPHTKYCELVIVYERLKSDQSP